VISDLLYRLRAVVRRNRMERDLEDELQFHIERETEKLERAGFSHEGARRRVNMDFGGAEPVKEGCRDATVQPVGGRPLQGRCADQPAESVLGTRMGSCTPLCSLRTGCRGFRLSAVMCGHASGESGDRSGGEPEITTLPLLAGHWQPGGSRAIRARPAFAEGS